MKGRDRKNGVFYPFPRYIYGIGNAPTLADAHRKKPCQSSLGIATSLCCAVALGAAWTLRALSIVSLAIK
jgi:hypothetical protein